MYRIAVMALAASLAAAACGDAQEAAAPAAAPPTTLPSVTTTVPQTTAEFACPVTAAPAEPFVPPAGYPPAPVEGAWFGTEDLWTVLFPGYVQRKSVWWSVNFGGGKVEERPEISVTWRRLDADAPPITEGPPGTNAFTTDEGWFMIAGIDPDQAGCWEATATYKSTTLSYVYEAP